MRLAVLLGCVLIAAGVFAVMLVALWRSNRAALHRGFMVELIWATIPCLILVAAATPAAIAVVNQG
jgi:heme/copper-type cytochrome/quinol oxidase subunit 2